MKAILALAATLALVACEPQPFGDEVDKTCGADGEKWIDWIPGLDSPDGNIEGLDYYKTSDGDHFDCEEGLISSPDDCDGAFQLALAWCEEQE